MRVDGERELRNQRKAIRLRESSPIPTLVALRDESGLRTGFRRTWRASRTGHVSGSGNALPDVSFSGGEMTRTPAEGMKASGRSKCRYSPKGLHCRPRTCPSLTPKIRPYSPVFEAVRVAIGSAQMPRFCPFGGKGSKLAQTLKRGRKRGSLASFTVCEGHFRAAKPMARVGAEPFKNQVLDLSLAAARPASRPWKGRSAAHYVSRPEMHELRTIT